MLRTSISRWPQQRVPPVQVKTPWFLEIQTIVSTILYCRAEAVLVRVRTQLCVLFSKAQVSDDLMYLHNRQQFASLVCSDIGDKTFQAPTTSPSGGQCQLIEGSPGSPPHTNPLPPSYGVPTKCYLFSRKSCEVLYSFVGLLPKLRGNVFSWISLGPILPSKYPPLTLPHPPYQVSTFQDLGKLHPYFFPCISAGVDNHHISKTTNWYILIPLELERA